MISLSRFFILIIILFLFPKSKIISQNVSKIPKKVFNELKKSNRIFNDKEYESVSLECLIPKKIVKQKLLELYQDLGKYSKEKKVIQFTIQSKGEKQLLKSIITKENKYSVVSISDGENLSNEETIKNLLNTLKKILQRKFINDYIKEIEGDIKKIDRQQNRIIRKNPKKLEMNLGLFYKIYQRKESKKVGLKAALEVLFKELDDTKSVYNSIN
tara:strand:- start:8010 stop:8651 length:642 start_codon:yes stop_codon:yes gene_type:complete